MACSESGKEHHSLLAIDDTFSLLALYSAFMSNFYQGGQRGRSNYFGGSADYIKWLQPFIAKQGPRKGFLHGKGALAAWHSFKRT